MFYGIEQSTDQRCPRTAVKKFSNVSALKRWLAGGGGYTHQDPDAARNHHRSFRCGYELAGRIDRKDRVFSNRGTRDYPRNDADNLATYIYVNGARIDA
jgi:hypothetical protein